MTTAPLTTKSLGSSGTVQIQILLATVIDGQNVPPGALVIVDVNTALNLTGGTNPVAALVSPLPEEPPPPPPTQTGSLAAFPKDSKPAQAQQEATAKSTAAWNKSMAQQAAENAATTAAAQQPPGAVPPATT